MSIVAVMVDDVQLIPQTPLHLLVAICPLGLAKDFPAHGCNTPSLRSSPEDFFVTFDTLN